MITVYSIVNSSMQENHREHGTGVWEWSMGLECGSGAWDWSVGVEHGTGVWEWSNVVLVI